MLQIARPPVVGAEQFGRHHLQKRLNFPLVRTCCARGASPPLPKRNAADVLLEHTALPVSPPCGTDGVFGLGNGMEGGQEEL